jgi:hypothetical protein
VFLEGWRHLWPRYVAKQVELFSSFCSGGRRRVGGFVGGLLIKGLRSLQLQIWGGAALPSAGRGGEGVRRRDA